MKLCLDCFSEQKCQQLITTLWQRTDWTATSEQQTANYCLYALQCSNEDYQNKILSKTDIWYCNLNITMLLVYWRFSLKRKYIIYTTSVVFIHHLLKPNDPISMMFSTTWMTPFVAGMSMLITLEPSIFNRSKNKFIFENYSMVKSNPPSRANRLTLFPLAMVILWWDLIPAL